MPDNIIPTRTVTGKFLLADKSPAQGTITFTPEFVGLNNNAGGNETYIAKPIFANLDTNGAFSVNLIIGNDDDGSVLNWSYLVTLSVSGFSQSYSIVLTTATPTTIDLADIIPSGTFAGVIPAYYTLSMGTTTTSTNGVAAATITGTFPNQTLNLTIPQGPAGPNGSIAYEPIQNLIRNPSAEVALAPWVADSATLTRSTTLGFSGTASFQLAATAANVTLRTGNAVADYPPVTPGLTYVLSGYIHPGALTGKTGQALIQFYNASNATVGTLATGSLALTASGWNRVSVSATAPATAVGARCHFRVSNSANGEVYNVDAAQLELGSTPTAYFDGDTFAGLNGSRWANIPHSSISSRGRHFYASDFFDFDDYFGELITMGYF